MLTADYTDAPYVIFLYVQQTSGKRLGDWAHHQLEVVTDKHHTQSSAVWNVEEHRHSRGLQLNYCSLSVVSLCF